MFILYFLSLASCGWSWDAFHIRVGSRTRHRNTAGEHGRTPFHSGNMGSCFPPARQSTSTSPLTMLFAKDEPRSMLSSSHQRTPPFCVSPFGGPVFEELTDVNLCKILELSKFCCKIIHAIILFKDFASPLSHKF